MQHNDGVCVCVVYVQRLGVSPRSLAQLVSETFNEMIFIHGDVHCDPHAANMVSADRCSFLVLFARPQDAFAAPMQHQLVPCWQ